MFPFCQLQIIVIYFNFSVTSYCNVIPEHESSKSETEQPAEMVDEVTGKPVEEEIPDKGTLPFI